VLTKWRFSNRKRPRTVLALSRPGHANQAKQLSAQVAKGLTSSKTCDGTRADPWIGSKGTNWISAFKGRPSS